MELVKKVVLLVACLAVFEQLWAADVPATPPHIYYLIHNNRLETALDHYQEYVNHHGRHDTEFLQNLGLSVLMQGAKANDPETMMMAIFGAGIAMNERALDILIRAVNNPHPQLQYIALNFLARCQDDIADRSLLSALRSNNLLIRLEAAKLIALKKLPNATLLIESLMNKVDRALIPLFPQLFAAIGDTDAIKILRRLLAHPDEEVRVEAVLGAAKAKRDDLLPKIQILAGQHSYALQEACAYAFGCFKDESTVPTLLKLSQSPMPQVRLQALLALHDLDRASAAEEIQKMAAKGDLFAIAALGDVPGSQDLLYKLTSSDQPHVRLNAVLGLLKLKDPRCRKFLRSILLRDQRDLAFVKMSSQGNSLDYWRAQPSTRQNYEDFSIDLELSQHFREAVLSSTVEMSEELFYPAIETIFAEQQSDLVPLAVGLLESLHTPKAVEILKNYQQRPGAPLIRTYCTLGLYRLNEEGPYAEQLCQWVKKQADNDLIQLRPIVPWEYDGELTSYQIMPHETSRLLVEAFEAFAQKQDDRGVDALLDAVRNGNTKNKYALAGLLMRAAL